MQQIQELEARTLSQQAQQAQQQHKPIRLSLHDEPSEKPSKPNKKGNKAASAKLSIAEPDFHGSSNGSAAQQPGWGAPKKGMSLREIQEEELRQQKAFELEEERQRKEMEKQIAEMNLAPAALGFGKPSWAAAASTGAPQSAPALAGRTRSLKEIQEEEARTAKAHTVTPAAPAAGVVGAWASTRPLAQQQPPPPSGWVGAASPIAAAPLKPAAQPAAPKLPVTVQPARPTAVAAPVVDDEASFWDFDDRQEPAVGSKPAAADDDTPFGGPAPPAELLKWSGESHGLLPRSSQCHAE